MNDNPSSDIAAPFAGTASNVRLFARQGYPFAYFYAYFAYTPADGY
jgi:hypothetical protein